jgi:glycosyltransferase involved in cell wall biosynthesis
MSSVFILPSLRLGGAEKVFSVILNSWESKCVLIVIGKKSENGHNITNKNVELVYLDCDRIIFAIIPLTKALLKIKPSIVFTTQTHLNILVLALGSFLHYKTVVREASVFSIAKKFDTKIKILGFLIPLFYNKAFRIICQSSDISNDLIENYSIRKSLCIIINNCFDEIISNYSCRIQENTKCLRIVNVGRFSAEKGHDRLLNILDNLNRPFKLYLVGVGSTMNKLKTSITNKHYVNNIEFCGNINPPYQLVNSCDLYIQFSYVEGFPNATLEALALGTPVIAYNVPGGTKELISNKNGILVPDGDYLKFAKAINEFNFNNYNCNLICSEIRNKYSPKIIINKYKAILYE